METNRVKNWAFAVLLALCFAGALSAEGKKPIKLYWFIPDGVRAEQDVFTFFKWAREGTLPNIKKLMEKGSYGYSVPVFPSHTPVNFATLLTGTLPKTHGIADGPMHIEGYELKTVSASGFRSLSRKVPAIWTLMEEKGKKVMVITTPGSTPPETNDAYVLRGRWGGWGADFHAVNFESKRPGRQIGPQGAEAKLFNIGAELSKYIDVTAASGWEIPVRSFNEPRAASLDAWGARIYCLLYDSTDDQKVNYDRIVFSVDKKQAIADLKKGEWSEWRPISIAFSGKNIDSRCRIKVIELDAMGGFRVRVLYDNLNPYIAVPQTAVEEIENAVGPMVAFVDNFPPQLIYSPEDKETFIEEMNMSFDWHLKLIPYIQGKYRADVVIHDNYNPNQMLTSRWWLGALDPASTRYRNYSDEERASLWNEVLGMYKKLDAMVGEILKNCDENTLIVFSSDHGVCVRNKSVLINNILAKNGYLKFSTDPATGFPEVDWKNTKGVYLQMIGIFINPRGLDGKYQRAKGEEYEKIRDDIVNLLSGIKDEEGICPFSKITKYEDAERELGLPKDRIGDLVIANAPGYGWTEMMSDDLRFFEVPLISGYKQAILPEDTKSLQTPFIISGPGVKSGHEIASTISNADQLPTILRLMNIPVPAYADGKVIEDVIQ